MAQPCRVHFGHVFFRIIGCGPGLLLLSSGEHGHAAMVGLLTCWPETGKSRSPFTKLNPHGVSLLYRCGHSVLPILRVGFSGHLDDLAAMYAIGRVGATHGESRFPAVLIKSFD